MADELQQRLVEARSHFVANEYDAALKSLATVPAAHVNDPKVVSNRAVISAVTSQSNYRAIAAQLNLPTISRVKSLKTGQLAATIFFQYDGQELHVLNWAALLLHNGAVVEARNTLMALANESANFSSSVRQRVAVLLQLATRRSAVDVSETTGGLIGDIGSADERLRAMITVAFSDTSGLHSWFQSTSKSPVESALYLNNLGVEAYADGKSAVAGVFFARASQSAKSAGCKFLTSSIAYNSAVCALARGAEGANAIQSLLVAKETMAGSAMLWLRLAQALLDRYHSASNEADYADFDAEVESRVHDTHNGEESRFPPIPPTQALPRKSTSPLINAAAQALHNALGLLVERSERLVETARRLASSSETALVLDALLSMLAYVELTRGNYGAVVTIATEFSIIERDLRNATTARTQAAMACYHVEALCASNRLSQALRVLQGINLSHFVSHKASNNTIEALMVNVCVAYIVSGQWAKAIQLSQQLVSRISAPAAQLLCAYLDLAQGNAAASADVIASQPQRS